MESWLSTFWSHLHTAEGLRQTIEVGGISLMCLIIFAETGLLAGFFLPGDSLLVTAGVLDRQRRAAGLLQPLGTHRRPDRRLDRRRPDRLLARP